MKKISPEKQHESEFEGRLSNIIAGVARLTSGITPIRNLTTTYLSWINLPLASEETFSWYLSASLYDGDKRFDRIGITTFMNKSRILGRNALSLTQKITIGATNTDELGNIVRFDYGIEINPSKRTVARISNENEMFFDFKSNPLTSRFGFNNYMSSTDVLGSFSDIVNAAVKNDLRVESRTF